MPLTVKTTRFGELTVDEGSRLKFVEGLLGFASLTEYVLYLPNPDSAFLWLQSAQRPDLAFVVCDPRVVDPQYTVQARPEEVADLQLADPSQVEVLVLVSHPNDASKMTVNLMGPIVINPHNRLARQLVLNDKRFTTRHRVFPDN